MKCGYPKLDHSECTNDATCTGFCKPHSRKKFLQDLLPWQIEKIKQLPPPPIATQKKPTTSPKPTIKSKPVGAQPTTKTVIELPGPAIDLKLYVERTINARSSLNGAIKGLSGAYSVANQLKDARFGQIKTRAYPSQEAFLKEAIKMLKFIENQTLLFKNQVNALVYGPEDREHNVVYAEVAKPAISHLKLPDLDLETI